MFSECACTSAILFPPAMTNGETVQIFVVAVMFIAHLHRPFADAFFFSETQMPHAFSPSLSHAYHHLDSLRTMQTIRWIASAV
jgi:hypothetical protein